MHFIFLLLEKFGYIKPSTLKDMQFWMIKGWAMDFSARGTITNQWKPTWFEL